MKKALILIPILSLLLSLPAYASEYSQDGTHTVRVTAVVESTYTVSLPASLALEKNDEGAYVGIIRYGAKGNIRNNQYIEIVPDASFDMTGAVTNAKATATVSSTKHKWVNTASAADEIAISMSEFTYSNANVSVNLDKADDYEGTFNFTYSIKAVSP